MDCDRYLELMSAALDGALSAGERRELDGHLAVCPKCSALFDELSGQSAALRGLDCDVPEGLTIRVMEGLPRREKKSNLILWKRWGALAACLVLVAVALGTGVPRMGRSGTAVPGSDYAAGDVSDDRTGVPNANEEVAKSSGTDSNSLPQEPEAQVGMFTQAGWNEQYLRVGCGSTPAPSALVLGDRESLLEFLAQFRTDDLSAVADAYGEDYFTTGRLVAVVVEASSGSVRYEITSLSPDQITIFETIPEVFTDDMAAWLILAEVDDSFSPGNGPEVVLEH